jgi:hypothetical protein
MSTAPLPTLDLPWHAAEAARHAEPASLRALLRDSRVRTLALADAWAATLGPQMQVPQWPTLNPPLWELGHVNWFARWWIGRNPHLARGLGADPTIERSPAAPNAPAESDAWYDSSRVAHAGRWSLPLPSLHHTVEHLAHGEDETLGLLAELGREPWAGTEDLDRALYFFRLALAHEDMHAEATVYMAHSLGHTLPEEWAHPCSERAVARRRDESGVWTLQPKPGPTKRLRVDATDTHIGHAGLGLFFDNEAPIHTVAVQAYEIDAQPLSWGEVLPFVASGAYARPEHWSQVGRAWREAQGQPEHPAVLKREGRFWRLDWPGRIRHGPAPERPRGRCLVPLGRPPPADRNRVGACRAPRERFCLGPSLGMDRQHLRALPRFCGAPVPRLFAALVWQPSRVARGGACHPCAHAPSGLSQLLCRRPQRCACGLSHLHRLTHVSICTA